MEISILDMMVHVHEPLPMDEMHRLEDYVRSDSCVISACTSPENSHMLMVTYNSQCTSSINPEHGEIHGPARRNGRHVANAFCHGRRSWPGYCMLPGPNNSCILEPEAQAIYDR